jgi:hypothetical protein
MVSLHLILAGIYASETCGLVDSVGEAESTADQAGQVKRLNAVQVNGFCVVSAG